MHIISGELAAKGFSFGIVVGRFNSFLTQQLQDASVDCLLRHGANESDITIVSVPGSFELPVTAARMLRSGKYDAIIALGVLIRGATPHFDYIAAEASSGLGRAAVEHDRPVAFGVITSDSVEQAIERSGTKAGNKGWEAAMAAIEMVNVFKKISST